MKFLINELSFTGQAKNDNEAYELLKNLYDIIQEVKPIQNNYPIQTHSSLSQQKILSNLTIHQWICQKIKSPHPQEQVLAKFLILILTKGPFIDNQVLLESCECYFNNKNITSSSLTGAVKLKGSFLSLQKSDDFVDETVEVTFREKNQSSENVTIRNLTQITQSRKLCPRYTGTPKHDSSLKGTAPSVKGTPMDLTIEEAQEVLNHSIDYKKKRYGYQKEKNKFYVFHPNNSYDSDGYPLYHGFPISDSQVLPTIKKDLGIGKP